MTPQKGPKPTPIPLKRRRPHAKAAKCAKKLNSMPRDGGSLNSEPKIHGAEPTPAKASGLCGLGVRPLVNGHVGINHCGVRHRQIGTHFKYSQTRLFCVDCLLVWIRGSYWFYAHPFRWGRFTQAFRSGILVTFILTPSQ
jgi:hypothetical protein